MQIFRFNARWNSACSFLLFFGLVCMISSIAALPIPSVKARSGTADPGGAIESRETTNPQAPNVYLHFDLEDLEKSDPVPADQRDKVKGYIKKGLPAVLSKDYTPILDSDIEGVPKIIEDGNNKLAGFGAIVTGAKKGGQQGPYDLSGTRFLGTMELDGDGTNLSLYEWGGSKWEHYAGPQRSWPKEFIDGDQYR
ncbi:hypothetical protein C8R42DRAFT_719851 [Lentinula raphanica]|nr:hypothetical protein C8R42DRAFT_719851 [Lentinula raphanica]